MVLCTLEISCLFLNVKAHHLNVFLIDKEHACNFFNWKDLFHDCIEFIFTFYSLITGHLSSHESQMMQLSSWAFLLMKRYLHSLILLLCYKTFLSNSHLKWRIVRFLRPFHYNYSPLSKYFFGEMNELCANIFIVK